MIMGGYGDRYNDWNAMLKKASNTMEGIPVLEDYFHQKYSSLISEVDELAIDMSRLEVKRYDDEEYVSSNVAVDDKRVYNRKKSSCEAKKVSKKKQDYNEECTSFFI